MKVAGMYPVEFIKDLSLIFFGNPDAIVLHLDHDAFGSIVGGDGYLRLVLGILYGIINEVENNIGEMNFIRLEPEFLRFLESLYVAFSLVDQ